MPDVPASHVIKLARREILVTLKSIYPSALPVEVLSRAVGTIVVGREWDDFRADLIYLCEKGYVQPRAHPDDPNASKVPWKRRWVRLTPAGVEVADSCITDPALDL
ncbi:MAG: hypothetical protein JXQ73_29600 [Phycisphaerae bacterium]|nr:hypothetical protein [Phycisphaerae bacterium]